MAALSLAGCSDDDKSNVVSLGDDGDSYSGEPSAGSLT